MYYFRMTIEIRLYNHHCLNVSNWLDFHTKPMVFSGNNNRRVIRDVFMDIITFQANGMAIVVKDIITGPPWFDWAVQKLVIQAIDAKRSSICQVPYGPYTKQHKNATYVLERCRTTRYTVETGWITELPHKSLSAPEHRLLFTYPPHVPNAPSDPLIVPKNKQEFDDVYKHFMNKPGRRSIHTLCREITMAGYGSCTPHHIRNCKLRYDKLMTRNVEQKKINRKRSTNNDMSPYRKRRKCLQLYRPSPSYIYTPLSPNTDAMVSAELDSPSDILDSTMHMCISDLQLNDTHVYSGDQTFC